METLQYKNILILLTHLRQDDKTSILHAINLRSEENPVVRGFPGGEEGGWREKYIHDGELCDFMYEISNYIYK